MGDGYQEYYGLAARPFDSRQEDRRYLLGPEAIEPYLVERLREAGWLGTPVLDLGLAPLLFEATGGEPAAIDRAMTALLEEAAREGRSAITGEGLAAWLDSEPEQEPAANIPPPGPEGLAEAQLEAIEGAFAEHDRKLARLRRELAELRDNSGSGTVSQLVEDRLSGIESRLAQQEQALRHVLERLIAFFEREGPELRP